MSPGPRTRRFACRSSCWEISFRQQGDEGGSPIPAATLAETGLDFFPQTLDNCKLAVRSQQVGRYWLRDGLWRIAIPMLGRVDACPQQGRQVPIKIALGGDEHGRERDRHQKEPERCDDPRLPIAKQRRLGRPAQKRGEKKGQRGAG